MEDLPHLEQRPITAAASAAAAAASATDTETPHLRRWRVGEPDDLAAAPRRRREPVASESKQRRLAEANRAVAEGARDGAEREERERSRQHVAVNDAP